VAKYAAEENISFGETKENDIINTQSKVVNTTTTTIEVLLPSKEDEEIHNQAYYKAKEAQMSGDMLTSIASMHELVRRLKSGDWVVTENDLRCPITNFPLLKSNTASLQDEEALWSRRWELPSVSSVLWSVPMQCEVITGADANERNLQLSVHSLNIETTANNGSSSSNLLITPDKIRKDDNDELHFHLQQMSDSNSSNKKVSGHTSETKRTSSTDVVVVQDKRMIDIDVVNQTLSLLHAKHKVERIVRAWIRSYQYAKEQSLREYTHQEHASNETRIQVLSEEQRIVREKMSNVIDLQQTQLVDVTCALQARREENEQLLSNVQGLNDELHDTKDLLFQLTDEYNTVVDEFKKDTASRTIQSYVRRRILKTLEKEIRFQMMRENFKNVVNQAREKFHEEQNAEHDKLIALVEEGKLEDEHFYSYSHQEVLDHEGDLQCHECDRDTLALKLDVDEYGHTYLYCEPCWRKWNHGEGFDGFVKEGWNPEDEESSTNDVSNMVGEEVREGAVDQKREKEQNAESDEKIQEQKIAKAKGIDTFVERTTDDGELDTKAEINTSPRHHRRNSQNFIARVAQQLQLALDDIYFCDVIVQIKKKGQATKRKDRLVVVTDFNILTFVEKDHDSKHLLSKTFDVTNINQIVHDKTSGNSVKFNLLSDPEKWVEFEADGERHNALAACLDHIVHHSAEGKRMEIENENEEITPKKSIAVVSPPPSVPPPPTGVQALIGLKNHTAPPPPPPIPQPPEAPPLPKSPPPNLNKFKQKNGLNTSGSNSAFEPV
jgi:hypothetical protein